MPPLFKKILGVTLILLGIVILITPLTPGAWIIFIGLQLLGFRTLFGKSFKDVRGWFSKKKTAENVQSDAPKVD